MTDPATSFLLSLGIEPFAFVAALGLALPATALVAILYDALRHRRAWATRALLVAVVVLAGLVLQAGRRHPTVTMLSDAARLHAR